MSDAAFIQVRGVTHHYPRMHEPALDNVDLQIPQGCSFGLLGPNGAGKTTLLSLLTGLLSPQAGEITIADYSLSDDPPAIKSLSALVPQDFAFYLKLTGHENLKFFAGIYGIDDSQWNERLEYCTQVCQLEGMLGRRVAEYSGGMKRRLNLAIGLLNQPKILYLDEPTVGIDALSRQVIVAAIQKLRTQGITVVYTSHYMEEIEAICDELAIINHGRVVARGRTADLRSQGSGRSLSLTFTEIPNDELMQALAAWQAQRIHERKIDLTLQNVDDMTTVLDTCKQHRMTIEQLQFGISRLEQTYLSLLKENEAATGESAT
ncbi:MAG: ABC transporter ATP-binding protein [Steroidobacter sp.]